MSEDKGTKRQTVILWLSRHPMQNSQIQELEQVFGDVRIVQVKKTHADIPGILSLAEEHHADEIVAVLPLSLVARLCQTRFKPILSVPKLGKYPVHDHFERILSVDVVSEPLGRH